MQARTCSHQAQDFCAKTELDRGLRAAQSTSNVIFLSYTGELEPTLIIEEVSSWSQYE